MSSPIQPLVNTLTLRYQPETVAGMIRTAWPDAPQPLAGEIARVIEASNLHRYGWSSMSTRFFTPASMVSRVTKARELALLFLGGTLPEAEDSIALAAFVHDFDALIGKAPGRASFKEDRRNRAARAAIGLNLSRRRYDKLFRLSARLGAKLDARRIAESRYRLVLVGQAALAPDLTLDDFAGHMPSAAFVAYYAARMKLRSEFTIDGQQQPFDTLAAELLAVCAADPATRWYAIAHVFPRADVLARLSEAEKGQLLGRWFDILNEISDLLEAAYRTTHIDLATMIVKRGNDSSTWNLLAGAWNRARDHWIALIAALGLDPLFDTMLPGKVMRLMAGDVAAWHRSTGGGVHPDTAVWAALPKPWDVLRGEAACTRADIEAVCAAHGVDAAKSGWTRPRDRTRVVVSRPTPELVHGVTVGNPYAASLLREIGAFSGKMVKKGWLDRLLGN